MPKKVSGTRAKGRRLELVATKPRAPARVDRIEAVFANIAQIFFLSEQASRYHQSRGEDPFDPDAFLSDLHGRLGAAIETLVQLREEWGTRGEATLDDRVRAGIILDELMSWVRLSVIDRSRTDKAPSQDLVLPRKLMKRAKELARIGRRLAVADSELGRSSSPPTNCDDTFVLHIGKSPYVELDGDRYPLTEDQARILARLAKAKGGLVSRDGLQKHPGSEEDPGKTIKRIAKPIRELVEGKPGQGGGRRLLRIPRVVTTG